METFLFGPSEQLFGAYYDGLGPSTAPCVLICNGLGQDYMRSHLVLRHLARQLSTLGGPVLQFDYRGTGDSGGDPEGNSLSDLREDTATALQELLDISGRPRAVIVGIRLGAWLALELGERVVAWDPFWSGADHVASLRALADELCRDRNNLAAGNGGEAETDPELAGYRYAGTLLEDLAMLDLPQLVDDRHYERLAVITANEAEAGDVTRVLTARTDQLLQFSAKPAHWNTVAQLERSLTPFPALTGLCEAVSRW